MAGRSTTASWLESADKLAAAFFAVVSRPHSAIRTCAAWAWTPGIVHNRSTTCSCGASIAFVGAGARFDRSVLVERAECLAV